MFLYQNNQLPFQNHNPKAMRKLGFTLIALCISLMVQAQIKVLGIGNSFSEDALEQNLAEIALSANVPMVIGNLYIGGCSIDRHLDNIAKNEPAYRYTKFDAEGKKTVLHKVSLESAIAEEQWDYVSVQQVSGQSGFYESYARLPELISWIKEKLPDAKILFHQTWAYAKDSKHSDFPKYESSQEKMYNAINEVVERISQENEIDDIVPSGPAIQNLRDLTADYDNTRDGYHLSLGMGRYTAACTWFATITGKNPEKIKYYPDGSDKRTNEISLIQARICQKAARMAVKKRIKIKKVNSSK